MKKQQFLALLATAAFLLCTVLAVQQRWRFPLVNAAVNSVLLPFNRAVLWVHDQTAGFMEDRRTNASLKEENAALKKELANFHSAEFRLARLEAENQRLQILADYKQAHPEQKLLPARVLGVSLGDLHEYFFLDKGEADGIKPDLVIIDGEGMVGVVDQVYLHYSRFMLLSGNRSRIGVKVLRATSKAVGVLTGNGPRGALLQAQYFGRDDDIQTGDMLVTSGIGGKYPAGLYIGKVVDLKGDMTGLQKVALVEPAAGLGSLDKVYVVLWEDESLRLNKERKEAGEALP